MAAAEEEEAPLIPSRRGGVEQLAGDERRPPARGAAFSDVCRPWTWQRSSQWMAVLALSALVLLIVGIVHFHLVDRFYDLLSWIKTNPLEGALVFVLVMFLGTIILVPGSLLWIAAGFVFQPLPFAALVAWVGSVLGLTVAFLLGRSMCRSCVEEDIRSQPEWKAVDSAIKTRGWKIVLLLRLAMVPYNVGNYMFGLTSVPFSEYVLASALGIVHKVFFFAYFGSLARDVHDLSSSGTGPSLSTTIAIAIVSGVAIIGVTVFIFFKAGEALREELARAEAQKARLDEARAGASASVEAAGDKQD